MACAHTTNIIRYQHLISISDKILLNVCLQNNYAIELMKWVVFKAILKKDNLQHLFYRIYNTLLPGASCFKSDKTLLLVF